MTFGGGFSPWFDGVRRSLEMPNSQYGDHLSDAYRDVVDIATANRIDESTRRQVAGQLLAELDRNSNYIEVHLYWGADMYDTPDLIEQYRSTLRQIRDVVQPSQETR